MRRTLVPIVLLLMIAASPLRADDQYTSGPWQKGSPRDDAGSSMRLTAPADTRQTAPWYGRNNMHKYLGLGAIAAAAVTIVAPKEEGGIHEKFAEAAAVLGGAAVATGVYAHRDDVSWDWSDPDTRHATYGALGALGFAVAVARGGKGGHAAAGALGTVAMVTAIKITW